MEYLCVVEYFFDEAPGGSGRVAWDIAKVMRDKGYSVTILFYKKADQEEGITDYQGVKLLRFQKDEKPKWHPRRLNAITTSTAKACRTWLNDRKWDIVHIHSPLMGVGVVTALKHVSKYIVTVHSPVLLEQEIVWKKQGFPGKLKLLLGRAALQNTERKLLKSADHIHTLSEYTLKIIDDSYDIKNKATVIPHWYEPRSNTVKKLEARKKLGWPTNAKIFLTVRGLGPRYGVDIAISALSELVNNTKTDCHFYIGGRGPLRAQLEKMVDELGVAGKIHFLGRLTDEELELAYSAADIFILPTLALECFGLITIEALSFGCPVISSDAAAIPEIMRPILPDCIVPAGDAEALREKAQQYLTSQLPIPGPDVLRDYIDSRYSKDKIVSKYLQMFDGQAVSG